MSGYVGINQVWSRYTRLVQVILGHDSWVRLRQVMLGYVRLCHDNSS